jgi:hypothetical protein
LRLLSALFAASTIRKVPELNTAHLEKSVVVCATSDRHAVFVAAPVGHSGLYFGRHDLVKFILVSCADFGGNEGRPRRRMCPAFYRDGAEFVFSREDAPLERLVRVRLNAGVCRRDGFTGTPVRFVVVFGVRVVYYSHSLFSVLSSKQVEKKAAGEKHPVRLSHLCGCSRSRILLEKRFRGGTTYNDAFADLVRGQSPATNERVKMLLSDAPFCG